MSNYNHGYDDGFRAGLERMPDTPRRTERRYK